MRMGVEPSRVVDLVGPGGDDVISKSIRELVGGIGPVAWHRHYDDGDTHQSNECCNFDGYIHDNGIGTRGRYPTGDSGHPRTKPGFVDRCPMKSIVGRGVNLVRVAVVELQLNMVVEGLHCN
ncbi:hypothetical protein GCM10020255_014660 [Rhodococcus baikonurensis]